MKLLFDQNLAPRLAKDLADLFPGSAHVHLLGLGTADDGTLWSFAKANGFTIASKDEDFHLLSVARGVPPKVLWLLLGNCTTREVESAIRADYQEIERFGDDPELGTLIIR